MKRLLFLVPGPSFPLHLPMQQKYILFSSKYRGDIIAPIWGQSYKTFSMGNFVLHGFPWEKYHPVLRRLLFHIFILSRTLSCHNCFQNFDIIISYDPLWTGVTAYILHLLTGAKLIVELNGCYETAFVLDEKKPGLVARSKQVVAKMISKFVLIRASHVKALYDGQINWLKRIKIQQRTSSFHDYVPISHLEPCETDVGFIFFLGYPWHLKGVDILIKAFRAISPNFPDYRLKIVGHCPNRGAFERLASGCDQIEFSKAMYHKDAMELMRKCSLFVLPSRSEAMGRVLLEAMACKRPIIASRVGGIPKIIEHGRTGLLFDSCDVQDLAEKMKYLLGDREYAQRLAEAGYMYVHKHLSERLYLEYYSAIIDDLTQERHRTR